ncbi:MAG TPA: response regulator [Thermoanaerobaculia bacterium]|nr:response regulator [Thermoanaerobaculia bacterium]
MSTDGPAGRILIVDDQVSNIRLLEFTLRRAGYVDFASTTEPTEVAALQLENRYDLILLDLQMPGMTGFEVMQQLRNAEGPGRVSILVISADPALRLAALEAGCDGFLSKPFVITELLERVQFFLAKAGVRKSEKPKAPGVEPHSAGELPDP